MHTKSYSQLVSLDTKLYYSDSTQGESDMDDYYDDTEIFGIPKNSIKAGNLSQPIEDFINNETQFQQFPTLI